MQKMLKTTRQSMSGEELVRAILKMEVDLFFNGGVGTYVKASWESNLDVGDKANENVRVDASDLRAKAVCEGGNLGFTMPARIEYAQKGGFINLDAIDNSAGVNTSDYEVNLKITLGTLVRKGQLDEESRLDALRHQADMVVNRVLWTNYHQSLAISLDRRRSRNDLLPFLDAIVLLERELPLFNRKLFHIPKKEKIGLVVDASGALVRPVLGTLLSYTKIFVKKLLLESDLPDEPFAQEYLLKYFPKTFATPEIRVECPDSIKFQVVEGVGAKMSGLGSVVDIDGVRVTFDDSSWALVRASNTQPGQDFKTGYKFSFHGLYRPLFHIRLLRPYSHFFIFAQKIKQ
jgi:glutamate dehydrogenase